MQALGGAKNHAVVLPDADLEFTADALVGAAYGSAGERCMAISAVVAVGDVGDRLVATLAEKAKTLKIGPGSSDNMDMGPLVTGAHRDKVKGYIDTGVGEGARLVVDGRGLKVPGCEGGFFLGPTLFDHVTPEMTIYKDEIFGPVLVVFAPARWTRPSIWSTRTRTATARPCSRTRAAPPAASKTQIEVGMVGINVPIPVPMAFYSFGGWKQSLFGDLHVHGMEGIAFYTRTKAVTSRWPKGDVVSSAFIMPTLGH